MRVLRPDAMIGREIFLILCDRPDEDFFHISECTDTRENFNFWNQIALV